MEKTRTLRRPRESGFALLSTAVGIIGMIGAVGLGVDIGRMYIAKNEAQVYADAAAMAAALELDGTSAGLVRAQVAVTASLNRHNLQTMTFSGTTTEFATSEAGPFAANPMSPVGVRVVRVTSNAPVNIYFMRVTGSAERSTARATATAAQVPKNYFGEGSFPFSPLVHNGSPDFGWTISQRYTLRWASAPRSGRNVCPGDDRSNVITQAEAGGGSERGFIEETSASNIRAAIVSTYQTRPVYVGGTVIMTGGAKQTMRDAIIERIGMDTDATSFSYSEYLSRNQGNGRRVVVVPVNDWHPNYIVKGFASMFLLTASEYPAGGNSPFCAEFIGPYVQGSKHRGGSNGTNGAFVVRLIQ